MTSVSVTSRAESQPAAFSPGRRRMRFFGLSLDDVMRAFFGGNALVAVVVLGLITLFLFREGAEFFGQNRRNLTLYRQSGLEYIDHMREQEQAHTALTRYLFDIRMRAVQHDTTQGLDVTAANARLEEFDAFAGRFSDVAGPLRGLVGDLADAAIALKTKMAVNEGKRIERAQLREAGRMDEADAVAVETIDFRAELQPIQAAHDTWLEVNRTMGRELLDMAAQAPSMPAPDLQRRVQRFQQLIREYVAGFPEIEARAASWDPAKPVRWWQSFTAFLFGREWITASFWQDWYGVLPLFTGSLMVSCVALLLAVPFGVGAAIYVSQLARPGEARFVKPCIEFIAAFPSVVLGFFGIAVLGELLRRLSQVPWLQFVPGFPIAERLNVLTAGCLLGLIAIPTIFTLAEDALRNVPGAFREASLALGATRLQTVTRIVVPAALSGIISAVLLGLGRVIGETMVVLLCAGNRIAIPDFTAGLGAFTQPVHTMTGIIAQEMGEVVRGDIHYRALFVLGILLFLISLLINLVAQKVVGRFRGGAL